MWQEQRRILKLHMFIPIGDKWVPIHIVPCRLFGTKSLLAAMMKQNFIHCGSYYVVQCLVYMFYSKQFNVFVSALLNDSKQPICNMYFLHITLNISHLDMTCQIHKLASSYLRGCPNLMQMMGNTSFPISVFSCNRQIFKRICGCTDKMPVTVFVILVQTLLPISEETAMFVVLSTGYVVLIIMLVKRLLKWRHIVGYLEVIKAG